MTRDRLQEIASNTLVSVKRLICQWCTGLGKSGVVLKTISRNPGLKTLIFVPEQDNISNWNGEFEKFGVPADNVTISCYASMHKYMDTDWDLLVFDEAPHVNTILKRQQIESIKSNMVLALGAVITDEQVKAIEDVYGEFKKSTFLVEDAVLYGILPKPNIVVCHMDLDDSHPVYHHKGRSFTAKGMYNILNNNVTAAKDTYDANPNEQNKQKMFTAGLKRKRFIGERKDEAINKICSMLDSKEKRYLCFCSSIKQAERIGGDHAYTSKTPKSMRQLERFNNHEINSLFVVGKLIEGQTLNDIQCGIIGQLGGTDRITIQSMGRIMRSINPVIYIPVFDGTKDDSFLYTVTDNVPDNYITHCKF